MKYLLFFISISVAIYFSYLYGRKRGEEYMEEKLSSSMEEAIENAYCEGIDDGFERADREWYDHWAERVRP